MARGTEATEAVDVDNRWRAGDQLTLSMMEEPR
jgi:hypothetical protein